MTLERKFGCPIAGCGARFMLGKHRNYHLRTVHEQPVKCIYENCESILKPSGLMRHINTVHLRLREACANCGQLLIKDELEGHLAQCRDARHEYPCSVPGCDKVFLTKPSRSVHMSKVHRSPPVPCPCPPCEVLLRPRDVALHVERVHLQVRTSCRRCHREILKSEAVAHSKLCRKQLARDHLHACPVPGCGALLSSRTGLNRHTQSYHEDERIECPEEGCTSTFKAPHLRAHLREFHRGGGALRAQCWVCGKMVSTRYLQQHAAVCANLAERKYRCTVKGCGLSFRTTQCRRRHELSVHSEPIECPFKGCSVLVKAAYLKGHIDSIHEKIRVECKNCGERVLKHSVMRHKKVCLANHIKDSRESSPNFSSVFD